MPTINGKACVVNGTPVDNVFSNGSQVYGRNLFSVRDWDTKPNLTSNSVPYMNIQLESNTAYTLTTNISRTDDQFDVFFFKDSEVPSSYHNVNGVNSDSRRTLTTSSTGNVKVGVRNHSLSDGTNWIKLEKGTVATPYSPALEDVSDYGRNLLTETGNHTVTGTDTHGYLSNETTDDLLTLFKGLEGQTVTVSVDYKYSGFIAGSGFNRIGWEVHILADSSPYFSAWHYPNNDSGSGRISSTFVVPKNITNVGEGFGYVIFNGSGTGTLSHLKLEKGSVATPWSPAPEDVLN